MNDHERRDYEALGSGSTKPRNAFQQFIAKLGPGAFITEAQMPQLISLHRLCWVLVRCGGCRFMAPAQDVRKLIAAVIKAGDYIRDCSLPVVELERADQWREEPPLRPRSLEHKTSHKQVPPPPKPKPLPQVDYPRHFREEDCGGVFDGNQVISDADPGL